LSADDDRARGPARWVLAGLGPPAVVALSLAVTRPADASWPLALGCALWFGLLQLLAASLRSRGARRAIVAAVALSGAPLWIEVGLRLASFSADPGLLVRFGYPDPELLLELDRDPELFWKLPADRFGVNALGFVGPEPELPKPPGRTRLVCLGDSCTESGYPALVGEALAAAGDERELDTVNLATSGYSSYQGRVLAERWLARLEPDVVAVYFGWNDHWLAWDRTDEQRASRTRSWRRHLEPLRAWQALESLRAPPAEPLDVPRVSAAEYRANLARIGALAEAVGARVLLLTAPSSHEAYGVPRALVDAHFGTDEESIVRLHARYNDVVRELARERGWELLDLAAEAPRHARFAELFTEDGIHPTWRGMSWVASRVAERLREPPQRPAAGR